MSAESTHSAASARQAMIAEQLRARGIDAPRVLDALARVPRERFVPDWLRRSAYTDRALPIACDQTISQPYIVALMTQALDLQGGERVLEVGTGSGYQAAILAELAREVYSMERHAELSAQAGRVLADLGYRNVTLLVGDGSLGWPAAGPYDRIIVTAAAARCPQALWEQLAAGGRLVIPLGDEDSQILTLLEKCDGAARVSELSPCRFVPLLGAGGWPSDPNESPRRDRR
jgi:protein-L-isoaspartate(D-aspartate) O-methyltransferase